MRRWIALGIAAAVVLAGLFATPNMPGRKAVFYWRNMECFKRPHDGGVAATGDSITAGTTDADFGFLGEQSWFDQLVCNRDVAYSFNGGVPNRTTEQVDAHLGDTLKHKPDVVVILTGTNDILHDLPLDKPLALLAGMADHIRAAGAEPVFATVPPFNAAPDRAAEFNRQLRELARTEHAPLIDFYPALVQDGRYRDGLSADGLHPNIAGAKVMAGVAEPVVRAALAR